MDLNGEDACDRAKASGMAREMPEFNNCNIHKKVVPLLPNGKHAAVHELKVFKKQIKFKTETEGVEFEYQNGIRRKESCTHEHEHKPEEQAENKIKQEGPQENTQEIQDIRKNQKEIVKELRDASQIQIEKMKAEAKKIHTSLQQH